MLNLKNTLDGYLKNVEVIGNTIQDANNLADIRSVGDKVEGQELYNISIQVDNGDGVSEVVEILSPVQLEKVGDVADRIICKDGVWGVEKNINNMLVTNETTWSKTSDNTSDYCVFSTNVADIQTLSIVMSNKIPSKRDGAIFNNCAEFAIGTHNTSSAIRICIEKNKLNSNDIAGFKAWLKDNNGLYAKYVTTQPQFIPLPHDQQVKLRTFAGQTNIAFLTEIPGQIKAQVPKSLGATVNTHTEQIKDLHNSLERVKKLEETTVSTVETESGFTTVDATSNGYFEDVKLEGKTLVNKFIFSKGFNHNTTVEIVCKDYKSLSYGKFTVPNLSNKNIGINIYNKDTDALIRSISIPPNSSIVIDLDKENAYLYNIFGGKDAGWTNYEELRPVAMFIEGDHTNNPPSYFEGLMSVGQDVEEVSVESTNGNLVDFNNIHSHYNEISIDIDKGTILCTDDSKYNDMQFYVYLERGNTYYFSKNGVVGQPQILSGIQTRYNAEALLYSLNFTGKVATFTYQHESGWVTLHITNFRGLVNEISLYRENNLGVYIPHQSNKKPLLYFNPTTETWEKPILREWDTIEKHSDGKYYYHKRSGEVVLNGSENYNVQTDFANQVNTIGFRTSNIVGGNAGGGIDIGICSHFNVVNQNTLHSSDIEAITQGYNGIYFRVNKSKLSTQDVSGFKAWLKANPTTVVYQLAKEEVYECTNIDLMTYSGETNYIINSGAISPKSLLKVHNNISNVVKILQEKVSLLENTFIAGLKSVLSGDMYSLATILYPEDFEQNDNTEQDIMVIPE